MKIKNYISIMLIMFCQDTLGQSGLSFDKYIDSLLGANSQIKYNDIIVYNSLKYDTVNKENNIGYWILEGCFKKLGIENYLNSHSRYLEKGVNINITLEIDTNGFVTKTFVNEKRVAKFISKKLVGSNFYKDYLNNVMVNGVCISKIDEDFYRKLLQNGYKFSFEFGIVFSNACRCGTKD